MSSTRPGWIDEPDHAEPVDLGQALAEWAAGQSHPGAADGKTEPGGAG